MVTGLLDKGKGVPVESGIEEMTRSHGTGTYRGGRTYRTSQERDSLGDTQNKARESQDQVRESPGNKVIFITEYL